MKTEFDKTLKTIRKKVYECPWSKEEEIKGHIEELLKEVKELKEAIEKNDKINLREEIGDVFYDSMFLMFLAERDESINLEEILKTLREKIERRTPWIFGNMKINTREEALKVWNEIKQKEKVKI
ncbi:MAG: nucleotide pyrophosphohydrolase [Candidatus Aenigmarchaeota archaeon]|nr:nucleotide pyrophosphohydrolase [Candidatus Aenigmarchaeota archaeon]